MYLPLLAIAAAAYFLLSSKKNESSAPVAPGPGGTPPRTIPLDIKPTNYGPGLQFPFNPNAQVLQLGALTPAQEAALQASGASGWMQMLESPDLQLRAAFANENGTYFDVVADQGGNKVAFAKLLGPARRSNYVTVGDTQSVRLEVSDVAQPAQVLFNLAGTGVVIRRKPKADESPLLGLPQAGAWILMMQYGASI